MKRNDAKEVFDIPTFNKIFPFMMKHRCDALVYQTLYLDMTKTVEFVRSYNKEHATDGSLRLKVFYVFVAAMMRTIAVRDSLNRFIASHRYWQRNELSLNFIIKENFTDEAPEHSSPIVIDPKATLVEVAKIIDAKIEEARNSDKTLNDTDGAIRFFMRFPYWFINLVVKIAAFLDKKGKAPAVLREADGLHTSIFISNLGSIGLGVGTTQHHLYEWGTTSLFAAIGPVERALSEDENGNAIKKYKMGIGLTVDERIVDGFYFVKSFMFLQDLLNNPEELLKVPTLPPPPLTKREYKAKLKRERKELKAKNKAKKSN